MSLKLDVNNIAQRKVQLIVMLIVSLSGYDPPGKVSSQFVPSYALIGIEWSDNGGEDASEVDLGSIRRFNHSRQDAHNWIVTGPDENTH